MADADFLMRDPTCGSLQSQSLEAFSSQSLCDRLAHVQSTLTVKVNIMVECNFILFEHIPLMGNFDLFYGAVGKVRGYSGFSEVRSRGRELGVYGPFKIRSRQRFNSSLSDFTVCNKYLYDSPYSYPACVHLCPYTYLILHVYTKCVSICEHGCMVVMVGKIGVTANSQLYIAAPFVLKGTLQGVRGALSQPAGIRFCIACNRSTRYDATLQNTFEEKTRAFATVTTTTTTTSPHLSPPPSHSPRSQQNPNSAAAASHSPPSPPAAYRTAMEALSVTPPESASPATAEHLTVIDDGPSSPPVPENTGTETQSISSAADEGKGGDAADAGDRRKVLPEELCRNAVKLPCESIAEGGICEVSASPATAEHFICIDRPASPPLPENTSTKIRSISYAANEDRGGDMAADAGGRRKVPPEELFRNVVKLSCESNAQGGICEVYLIGTAHVSEESCQEVKAVIGFAKPQVVFLELCPSRTAVLCPQNLKVPTMRDMVEIWKTQHDIFGILYSWFLAKVASKLEVCPGSEFRVACEEALKYDDNVQVKLGDRPVQITLQRTWAKMPLWHKTKLLYSVVFQAFFLPSAEDLKKMLKEMDNVDMLTRVIQDMSKQFPTLMETLVHERDQYVSATLFKVAGTHSSIVAVVGKGHLEGIKNYWMQSVELEHLEHVDMTSRRLAISAVKLLTTVGVAVAGVAMISGLRGGWLF
ncbi:uncharacterized protein LOC131323626 [Rhododendron vialii]|uniref:uncharacterized protein LOC131323626 n=1 Tax=Rhododendron vialii TaxID=182163 RepID=UPI00265F343E|nr:uncharacterized protein LOC131323626 [Rhododendron vialii]